MPEKILFYRVFVYWFREREAAGIKDFKSRADAVLHAKYLRGFGYEEGRRSEIQIWKVTKEPIEWEKTNEGSKAGRG